MTKTNMDPTELLKKHDRDDLVRPIAEAVLQLMMDSDVANDVSCARGCHPFRIIKRQFGHVKTRYRGLAKNRASCSRCSRLAICFSSDEGCRHEYKSAQNHHMRRSGDQNSANTARNAPSDAPHWPQPTFPKWPAV